MTQRARALLHEALALPLEDRANVAAELLASLEETPAEDASVVEAAWASEIERRAMRVLSGESTGEPWDAVRERTARRLAEQ
jgi:putative addiction module component (TIGR02574 family)